MNELIQCTTSHRNFQRWLGCGSYPITFLDRDDNPVCPLIQLEKSKEVSYLYHAILRGDSITWDYDPQFIGAYNRTNQSLYLTRGFLSSSECARTELAHTEAKNNPTVKDEIIAKVSQCVEDTIGGRRENLSVTEITGEYASRELADYLEYGASSEAEDRFFEGREPDGQFHSGYTLKELSESAFLAYAQDPEQFIQKEAERYLQDNQETFLLQFLKHDALTAEYQALVQDTANPLHRAKAITEAVEGSGAKTVTVTIQKDNQKLEFKVEADHLAGQRSFYTPSHIVAATERREFEQRFGRWASFKPDEITKITYGKNTIYEAPPAPAEEMAEEIGIGEMRL